ncbi:hypothetical protein C8J57DRAFT_1301823 [Mycena rebaudengoi]|nr:hypothetical protein C8J57DRAFT_1301823 [Mycena rebaudengoi]
MPHPQHMKHCGLLLPDDIWQCVASFIPQQQLLRLISVNRAFYDIVLDAKYREVLWVKLDEQMIKSLVRLRTPSIACRVRRLHVRAWFLEYLIRKESFSPPSYAVISKRWVSRHLRLPSTPLRLVPSSSGTSSAAKDIMESMTKAVHLMKSVTEYSFEWRDLSLSGPNLRFLESTRTAFGSSLRKLTLHAKLRNFTNLLSTVDFDNLEELELNFDHDQEEDNVEERDVLLRDTIAPFINHFRQSLGTLVISSASESDLSSLFPALQVFTHLRKLVLRLGFDSGSLADPWEVVKVLQINSENLSAVELARSSTAPSDGEQSIWTELTDAVLSDSTVLANLHSLRIPVFNPSSATMVCLRRSADTLTSLVLVDHYFWEKELIELVHIFSHRPHDAGLNRLTIGVARINASLFDLFATRLPGLAKLNLVLAANSIEEPFQERACSSFCSAMLGRSYPDWNLSDLGIWEKRFEEPPISTRDEGLIMEHLARCIPKISKFKGVPKPPYPQRCLAWESWDATHLWSAQMDE